MATSLEFIKSVSGTGSATVDVTDVLLQIMMFTK